MDVNNTITVRDIVEVVESISPCALQEEWDNSGLTIGFQDSKVKRVLTCMEINDQVAEEAIDLDVDMIITHHPLIFGAMKSLDSDYYMSNIIMKLIRKNISVYSCHTPFDKVKGGNNDIVMSRLGLINIKNLDGQDVLSANRMSERHQEADIGRMGSLKEPASLRDVIQLVADKLELSIRQISVSGSLDTEINKIGVCTGAGADLAEMAASSGCELFITGDVKYHEAQNSLQKGICIMDAGHYGTEKFFAGEMKKKIEKKMGNIVEIIESKIDLDPFIVL